MIIIKQITSVAADDHNAVVTYTNNGKGHQAAVEVDKQLKLVFLPQVQPAGFRVVKGLSNTIQFKIWNN